MDKVVSVGAEIFGLRRNPIPLPVRPELWTDEGAFGGPRHGDASCRKVWADLWWAYPFVLLWMRSTRLCRACVVRGVRRALCAPCPSG